MYRFSYVEKISGRAQEVCLPALRELISREQVAAICARIAAQDDPNEVSRLKRQLPALCWHAWFDNGQRKNGTAHPSGLVMIDVDHVEEPRALFLSLEEQALRLRLLAAHITPSGRGLRLVFPVPQGMDIVQAQSYYAGMLHLQVDACTKDLARLSFCVPQDYWLYLAEERLFGEAEEPPVAAEEGATGEEMAEEGSAVPVPAEPATYPAEYDSIPYEQITAALQELMGGVPAHGSRNNFIFSMAAYLRYVCNDDPAWIASILPTYGETADKWRRTIDSACQRAQYKQMPEIMRRAIDNARHKQALLSESEDEDSNSLPPPMPRRLPRLIRHLVKNVPAVCRPAVANAVFPALATHLHDVRFRLVDGTEKEPTFMCVTMAPQSSGKSAVNKPIEYITADIVERDELNRKREQEWKEATAGKAANKEKPKRPDDLCVQVLVSDMTNAAFVQRLNDAKGRYLYTNLEELDLLKQLQTNGTKDVGKIICLCFDNGMYGQERVGAQSVTARVPVRWNWNASSTIHKGREFFRNRLVDGTLSRINFCTIIPDKSQPFVYGRYDDRYAETLRPFISNLNLATGEVACKEALELARKMQERCAEEGALTDDDVYSDLAYRAVTIAYLKSMVLYIANDMRWTSEIAAFAEWSLQYDLWCKSRFFGEKVKEEKQKEEVRKSPGRRNLLDLLPEAFTREELIEARSGQGLRGGVGQLLSQWVFRGYITRDDETGRYLKTPDYLKRKKVNN